MNIPQKLKLIKKVSNLSQEKLAKQLGVSFVAFNAWINGRSLPRKKAQDRINNLFLRYTGQEKIPNDILTAKKQVILGFKNKFKNVLNLILNNSDIYDQLILSLTYHTNRVEGSTLTESETKAILFDNIALADKSIIEQLEVKNHQAALHYLLDRLKNFDKKISESFILRLHSILMNGIRKDAGSYRTHAVRIVGANVPTANYLKVPSLIKKLIKEINREDKDVISRIAHIHSKFEKIHPFGDGNGRVGRLIIQAMLLENNLPPAIIKQEKKHFYKLYLGKSQRVGDFSQLEDFLCDAIMEGLKIIERKII